MPQCTTCIHKTVCAHDGGDFDSKCPFDVQAPTKADLEDMKYSLEIAIDFVEPESLVSKGLENTLKLIKEIESCMK